jgi:dihydrofolate synthase / folylpolyglutamate synthase
VVLDGAHNPHGAAASAAALAEAFDFRDLVLVVACLEGKDVVGILEPFRTLARHVVVTTAPSSRALPLADMERAVRAVWDGTGTVVELADDVVSALELAEAVVGEGDGMLVTGSLHTVGAARDRYLPVSDPGSWATGDGWTDADDEVVREPGDEPDEADVEAELVELLADDDAFEAAIERLLDEDPEEGR